MEKFGTFMFILHMLFAPIYGTITNVKYIKK